MNKQQNPLVAFVLNAFTRMALMNPAKALPKKGGRDKKAAGLPYGYPGAKMARAAKMGRVGVKHLGLRVDGRV